MRLLQFAGPAARRNHACAYNCSFTAPESFQDFAEIINQAVDEGLTDDELVDVAIDSRNKKFGSGGWADANQKVVDIIKNDPSLEN
jgi:hypothetical protein